MKKFIFSLSALAALLLAGSCQRENLEPVEQGNTVTYTVQMPGALATKASGDGFTLHYEVYRQNDVDNLDAKPVYEGTEDFADGVANVELEFVKDQNFAVLFWAQKAEAKVYNIADLRKVSISNTQKLLSNNFEAEVFAGNDLVENCASKKGGNVVLFRPIAQLNIATDAAGLALGKTTVVLQKSYVKVTGLSTTYNVFSGYGSSETTPAAYGMANVPTGTVTIDTKEYTYVAMNYVGFMPEDDITVDVEFAIQTSEGTINHTVRNVPVKANYKTNIVGNLITATDNYSVSLSEDWEETETNLLVVNTAAGLKEAINNAKEGEEITLTGNIDLAELFPVTKSAATLPIVIEEGKSAVLNLNGYTITTPFVAGSTTNHTYAFENHGVLTIKDTKGEGKIVARGNFNYGNMTLESGTIEACDGNGGYGVRNYEGAEFVMNGGSIVTSNEDDHQVDKGGYDATTLRVDEGATAIVNGGTINNICDFTFALDNHGTTTVNGGTFTSIHTTAANYGTLTINRGSFTCNGLEGITAHALWAAEGTTTINGGTFDGKDNYNGFNVDASAGAVVNITGGKFLTAHSGSLYGEGTINVTGGEFFEEPVIKIGNKLYKENFENDLYNLQKNTISLFADIQTSRPITTIKDLAFMGNGHTITYTGSDRVIDVKMEADAPSVTIKDLTIVTTGYTQRGINYNTNGTLVIDNVKVSCSNSATAVTYAINLPGSSDNAKVSIKNSDLTGGIALNVWGENCVINVENTKLNTYDASTAEGYSTVKLNNDGTTSAEGSVINITGGSINISYKNADDNNSSPVNNATATGKINISESTVVDGEIDDKKNSAAVRYKGSNDFYAFVELQDAINKAAENAASVECVRILRDVELTETVVVPAGLALTLDLNEYTITGPDAARDSEGNRIHVLINNGILSIQNGTIKSIAINGGSAILNKGTLTLNNVTVNGAPSDTATGTASYAVNTEGAGSKLTVNNSNISGRGAIGATEGTKVELNGGTYHTPAVAWGHAVYATNEGTEVVINDGIFSEGYEMTANNWGMYQIYSGDKAKVTVMGGTFMPWDCANGYDLCTANEGTIEIYGGTFADNPASQNKINYVADGYISLKIAEQSYTVVLATGTLTMNDGSTLDLCGVEFTGTIEALGDLTIIGDTKIKTLKATNGGTITIEDGKTLTLNNFSFGANATADAEYMINGGTIVANYGFFQHGKYALYSNFETGYMYYSYGSDITVYGTFHSQGKGDGLDYIRGKLTIANGGKSIHDKSLWVGQPAHWGPMNASLTIEAGGYVQANSLSVYEGSSLTYSNVEDLKYNSVTGTEYITKK